MNKIPCASQNTEAKTLPVDVASLVALYGFQLLLATQLTANLTPKRSDVSIFYPLSHIYVKNSFLLRVNSCKQHSESSTRCCFWSTMSKRGTHFEHSFLIDKYSHKMVNTLPSDIFNFSVISRNFNLRSAETSLWISFCVFRDNCQIETTWASSIICVCKTAFNVSIPFLNRCFRRSRVQIAFIKPLLCLNSIFPIRKQCFIDTRNLDFSIVLKICNSTFTWITVICKLIIWLGLNFDTSYLKVSTL